MANISRVIVAAAFLAVTTPVVADNPKDGDPKWRFIIENDVLGDLFTNANDDRNYTMGLTFSTYGDRHSDGRFASALRFFDEHLFPANSGEIIDDELFSFDVGVSAFTPNLLEERLPIQGDRPYACVTFASKNRTRAYPDYARRTKLVVGVLGLDICKAVQRYLHNQVGVSSQDPLGWDNQISEGGEPTGLYSSEYLNLRRRFDQRECTRYEVASKYGYHLGYYTNVFAGGSLRVGRVCTPYYLWDANPNSTETLATPPGAAHATNRDHFGFIAYQARLIGYNALLQGQFRDSEVTFSGSGIERLIHEASAGWTFQFRSLSSITYAVHYRSTEIKGPFSRAHWYGSLVYVKSFQGRGTKSERR